MCINFSRFDLAEKTRQSLLLHLQWKSILCRQIKTVRDGKRMYGRASHHNSRNASARLAEIELNIPPNWNACVTNAHTTIIIHMLNTRSTFINNTHNTFKFNSSLLCFIIMSLPLTIRANWIRLGVGGRRYEFHLISFLRNNSSTHRLESTVSLWLAKLCKCNVQDFEIEWKFQI